MSVSVAACVFSHRMIQTFTQDHQYFSGCHLEGPYCKATEARIDGSHQEIMVDVEMSSWKE